MLRLFTVIVMETSHVDELGDVTDRRIVLSAFVCKTEVKNNYIQHSLLAIFMLGTLNTGQSRLNVFNVQDSTVDCSKNGTHKSKI